MGEIADGMIDGEFDYETGEYLGESVGYPRTQQRSFKSGKASKCKALNGVMKYLGISSNFTEEKNAIKFIREYCKIELNFEGTLKGCAREIQKDFKQFKLYLKKNG